MAAATAHGAACPCGRASAGRPLSFAACCGRYLDDFDGTPAPDAEALMRSRYSAFVLGRADYLLATWAAAQRPDELALDAGAKWLGLQVRGHRRDGQDRAEVEFVARYRLAGRAVRLHERSRFIRDNGRWYYTEGDALA
jgi:SEC-C motif-containing protein